MTNLEIDQYLWIVDNNLASPSGLNLSLFTYLDPGTYEGKHLEVIHQYRPEGEIYWDNILDDPAPYIRKGYEVRILIRDATEFKKSIPVPYQAKVLSWVIAAFGVAVANDKVERGHRFLEEAIELSQSVGVSCENAHRLVDHIFNKPEGEINQEIGGVMVTLAALCSSAGEDMVSAGENELSRVWLKIDEKREKFLNRPVGSALPV